MNAPSMFGLIAVYLIVLFVSLLIFWALVRSAVASALRQHRKALRGEHGVTLERGAVIIEHSPEAQS